MYGIGVLLLNYFNEYDCWMGCMGGGIWLYGVFCVFYVCSFYVIEGCVVLVNDDMVYFMCELELCCMLVIIVDEVIWVRLDMFFSYRVEFCELFFCWMEVRLLGDWVMI